MIPLHTLRNTISRQRPWPRTPSRHVLSPRRNPPRRYTQTSNAASSNKTASKPAPTTAEATAAAPPAQSPAKRLLSKLATPLRAYRHAAQTRPYTIQLLTSTFIWFSGDLLAQQIERSSTTSTSPSTSPIPSPTQGSSPNDPETAPAWDIPRTARALAIGLPFAIPAYHWYTLLSRSFTTYRPAVGVFLRVCAQQAVFAPVFSVYFFFAQAVLAGAGVEEGVQRVVRAVPESWVNSMRVWPVVMAVNFAVVPVELRSLVPGFVAVGWQCYLCVLNQRTARAVRGREEEMVA